MGWYAVKQNNQPINLKAVQEGVSHLYHIYLDYNVRRVILWVLKDDVTFN